MNIEKSTMNTEDMTNEELKQLRQERYHAACQNGTFAKLGLIARQLGHDPASRDADGNPIPYRSSHGPKYVWRRNNIKIYVDDYGHYMTVHMGDREMASTHQCSQFIIPGDWIAEALSVYEVAVAKANMARQQKNDHERRQLLQFVV